MNENESEGRSLRGARADAEMPGALVLIKRSSELRATYQLRLLTYRAEQERKILRIDVPASCIVRQDLIDLVNKHRGVIEIVRL